MVNDGFIINMHLFASQASSWWIGMVLDYLWIIVMLLSPVWTLILTAPIHCRASIDETLMNVYIYIYAFSRRFYPKRFRLHIYCQYMCSLGIEPTTFALITQCSTTEPQKYYISTCYISPNLFGWTIYLNLYVCIHWTLKWEAFHLIKGSSISKLAKWSPSI